MQPGLRWLCDGDERQLQQLIGWCISVALALRPALDRAVGSLHTIGPPPLMPERRLSSARAPPGVLTVAPGAATNVPATDLAATTAAFVLLARAAACASTLARLELQLGPLLTRGGQQCAPGGAGRESGMLRRVLQALQETLAANGLLRCAPPPLP